MKKAILIILAMIFLSTTASFAKMSNSERKDMKDGILAQSSNELLTSRDVNVILSSILKRSVFIDVDEIELAVINQYLANEKSGKNSDTLLEQEFLKAFGSLTEKVNVAMASSMDPELKRQIAIHIYCTLRFGELSNHFYYELNERGDCVGIRESDPDINQTLIDNTLLWDYSITGHN